MAKKSIKKIAAKDADQYMLRLPPGLRDRVARRAAENGRSMNTEIIDAIEKHLEGADRITQLWDLFKKHRKDLEAIPYIWYAVECLEDQVGRTTGDAYGPLTKWRMEHEEEAITFEQALQIRVRLRAAGATKKEAFLKAMKVDAIEDIKDFSEAMRLLDEGFE